jgi:drug/metabolite transporter (DMT)-like permease
MVQARVLVALAVVYVVWGSTYFAIKVGLDTLPPMLMGGIRFLAAGAVLYGWTAWRARGTGRVERLTRTHWLAAAVAGTLMLVGGNGAVTWAEQRIDSGVAALLVATVPLWMALLGWWRQGERLRLAAVVGLGLGFVGVGLLVRPSGHGIDLFSALVVMGGALAWAIGSLYVRTARLPADGLRAAAMQMLAAGGVFSFLGLASGELGRLDVAAVSWASAGAVAYLAAFGSIVAFSAYTFLLRNVPPATVSTYAYVNPVVAVFLGAVLLAEPVTSAMLGSGALILIGVALIVSARAARRRPSPAQTVPSSVEPAAETAPAR